MLGSRVGCRGGVRTTKTTRPHRVGLRAWQEGICLPVVAPTEQLNRKSLGHLSDPELPCGIWTQAGGDPQEVVRCSDSALGQGPGDRDRIHQLCH